MEVTLIDLMGTDLTVVDAARVSFNKESNWGTSSTKELFEKDEKLIKYLASHGHWTPFSHPMITMREKVPIFVARQRFKHMVGFTYNEVSRRYVDDAPEFYTPDVWRKRAENKKQGSSDEEIKTFTVETIGFNNEILSVEDVSIKERYESIMKQLIWFYKDFIKNGVAPEQARMVLPQSMYTEYYTTGSLAAWARAYKLRIDSHSQKEIQDLAVEWNKIIRPLFPVSWSALVD